jgi:hypothetical protein
LSLRYADGSTASVTYASGGHPSLAKERLEVLGRGHAVVVDDYRSIVVDGMATKGSASDKGHVAELRTLLMAIEGGGDLRDVTTSAFETTRATLAALESLSAGLAVTICPR